MAAESSRVPPPEAQLIRRHREALGISPETAVERLPIKLSARRWRQIELGAESRGGVSVDASAMQLAHMAKVVGVTPDQLTAHDKGDAAEILRVILQREAEEPITDDDRRRALELMAEADRLMAEARRLLGEGSEERPAAS